jgi:hypothetical protein
MEAEAEEKHAQGSMIEDEEEEYTRQVCIVQDDAGGGVGAF